MDKLADISEPQVLPIEQNRIDLFAHLAELGVLIYLPSCPHWLLYKRWLFLFDKEATTNLV